MRKSFVALSIALAVTPAAGFAAHAAKSLKAGQAPVAAEPAATAAPELRFEPVLSKLDKKVAGLFGAEVQKQLRLVAEAAVLTDYCASVNLNQQKFKEAFEAVAAEGGAGRKPAEQRIYENKLSMYYGVYVGLLVAEGTEWRAEFCGFADRALKEGRPIARYWIPTAPTPSAGAGGALPAAGAKAVPLTVPAVGVPVVPALPKMPEVTAPGLTLPSIPKAPGVMAPQLPSVSTPSLPSIPGASGLPAVPNASVPSVPSLPGAKVPKVPAAADVPATVIPKP